MKTTFFRTPLPIALFLYAGISLSAVPITVTFNSGTTSFASNGSGTANYVVNVKGIVPPNVLLTFNSNPNSSNGLTANQVSTGPSLCSGVNTVCSSPTFSLKANQSCCLEYALTGSNAGNYTLQPSVSSTPVDTYRAKALSPSSITVSGVANTTPLTATPSTLALSVGCLPATSGCAYTNTALSGNSRQITIKNTSTTDTTTPLTVAHASFAPGTNILTDGCTGVSLAPQGTCTITIKPGQEASLDSGNNQCTTGTQPNPGTVTVNASSAPSATSSNVYVLSYGCIYQGGFIYSVDDSYSNYPELGSIGGKIAAINDTVPGQTSPNVGTPNWGGFGTDACPLGSCYDNSSSGVNNGGANTATIVNTLDSCTPSTPYSSSYAACLCTNLSVNASGTANCTSPDTCYTNWYLPAICELGPFTSGSACTIGSTNIQDQLYNATPPITANLVNNAFYWSSTESTAPNFPPQNFAWGENFSTGGSFQNYGNKNLLLGVRCSRALTL